MMKKYLAILLVLVLGVTLAGCSEAQRASYNLSQQKVYDAGYNKGSKDGQAGGYLAGYNEGYDDGEQRGREYGELVGERAQYDLFWDTLQQNGNRADYEKAFCGWMGAQDIFKPKYDIKPTGRVNDMFRGFRTYISLSNVCQEQGIVMDFSKVTEFTNFLYNTAIYQVGVIDCSSTTTLGSAFNNASSLNTIEKLIVHEGITSYTSCFENSNLLKNITIEGVIAGTNFNISRHNNLTFDSLVSIILALKDYSGTSTTKTVTLGATNLAKLTDSEKAIATQKGWTLA